MACNQYTVSFSTDAVISFTDCSGYSQTFSGKSGNTYYVFADSSITIPISGVGLINNGQAQRYSFEGCCGGTSNSPYFSFDSFSISALTATTTFGSKTIQFGDGAIVSNKCYSYVGNAPSSANPYTTIVQVTGGYKSAVLPDKLCTTCASSLGIEYCQTEIFKKCCDNCENDETGNLDCYVGVIGKSPGYNIGNIYTIEDLTQKFCVKYVKDSFNFYSIQEYNSEEITITGYTGDTCTSCVADNPCVTPPAPSQTPTPTPTPRPNPTPTPKKKFYNECDVVTIFEMGVECSSTQPTNPRAPDGSIVLNITGGTPPYTIAWSNNNIGQAIYNLGPGAYEATVVDYYGDFTAKTICVLTGETTSTTTTSTTVKPEETFNVCLVVSRPTLSGNSSLVYNGIKNGKPSWKSGIRELYWDNVLNQWTAENMAGQPSGSIIINTNPTYPVPPATTWNNWQILSSPISPVTVQVTLGDCTPKGVVESPLMLGEEVQELNMTVSVNQPICGCEGTMTLVGTGGSPPYMYSINSGLTFRNIPFFTNLCTGTYTPIIMDSSGASVTQTIVLNKPSPPVNYLVKTNTVQTTNINNGTILSKTYTTTLNVTPPLPDGVTLTIDFSHINRHQMSTYSGSSIVQSNTEFYNNSIVVSATTTGTTTATTLNTISGCQDKTVYVDFTTEYWNGVQITNTDNIEIVTNTILTKLENNACYIGNTDETYTISNLKISGCGCCRVTKIT